MPRFVEKFYRLPGEHEPLAASIVEQPNATGFKKLPQLDALLVG
jgi:hypothetical protein